MKLGKRSASLGGYVVGGTVGYLGAAAYVWFASPDTRFESFTDLWETTKNYTPAIAMIGIGKAAGIAAGYMTARRLQNRKPADLL